MKNRLGFYLRLIAVLAISAVVFSFASSAMAADFSVFNAEAQSSQSSGSSSNGALGNLGVERVTFDLGAGFGSYNNSSYSEADLGLNLFFTDYIAWRNAVWVRFGSDINTYWGLDTSVRAIGSLGGKSLGLTAFVGPGFRFASQGDSMPFLEGGLVCKVAGLAIGLGAKELLDSWVHSGASNDTQYFIILAGGGAL